MEYIKGCKCRVCLPDGAVPPPNPPPAGDKEEPTPGPSQEGNKPCAAGDKREKDKTRHRGTYVKKITEGTILVDDLEMRGRDYKNESQQNLIKIVEYLARDVFKPATTQEIMEAIGLTKSKAHWTLHNLKIGGWAEQVSGGWRLSPELVKIADSVRATLKEVMHRYL